MLDNFVHSFFRIFNTYPKEQQQREKEREFDQNVFQHKFKPKNNRKRTRGRIVYHQEIKFVDGTFEIKNNLRVSRIVTKRITHRIVK